MDETIARGNEPRPIHFFGVGNRPLGAGDHVVDADPLDSSTTEQALKRVAEFLTAA